eukprot:15437028-Alexandrium_andersonii.AAC.1
MLQREAHGPLEPRVAVGVHHRPALAEAHLGRCEEMAGLVFGVPGVAQQHGVEALRGRRQPSRRPAPASCSVLRHVHAQGAAQVALLHQQLLDVSLASLLGSWRAAEVEERLRQQGVFIHVVGQVRKAGLHPAGLNDFVKVIDPREHLAVPRAPLAEYRHEVIVDGLVGARADPNEGLPREGRGIHAGSAGRPAQVLRNARVAEQRAAHAAQTQEPPPFARCAASPPSPYMHAYH